MLPHSYCSTVVFVMIGLAFLLQVRGGSYYSVCVQAAGALVCCVYRQPDFSSAQETVEEEVQSW